MQAQRNRHRKSLPGASSRWLFTFATVFCAVACAEFHAPNVDDPCRDPRAKRNRSSLRCECIPGTLDEDGTCVDDPSFEDPDDAGAPDDSMTPDGDTWVADASEDADVGAPDVAVDGGGDRDAHQGLDATAHDALVLDAPDTDGGNEPVDDGGVSPFDPIGPVSPLDLNAVGLSTPLLKGSEVLVDADRGRIMKDGVELRPSNEDVSVAENRAGIRYEQREGLSIFVFASLTIPEGTVFKITGTSPVVLASTGNIIIDGVVDVRPMNPDGALCASQSAGPAAGRGGIGANACGCGTSTVLGRAGEGPGAGQAATQSIPVSGGSGAGHSATGGNAGAGQVDGGVRYGTLEGSALEGGSGGGGGGSVSDNGRGGEGGGGGGALHLVARGAIRVGYGKTLGGINAGGCGGGQNPSGRPSGGGGGGSGGTVVLEASSVQLGPLAAVAANGGGGGTHYSRGEDGALSAQGARGGGPQSAPPVGGNGGAGDVVAGQPGGVTGSSPAIGAGGGGAAGYIRIRSLAGRYLANPKAIVSPAAASGATSIGVVDLIDAGAE